MTSIGHNGGPMDGGWIKKYRAVRDHWLVGHGLHVKPGDPSKRRCHTQGEAWEDLLMECRYDDGFVSNGGKKMELRRGELIGAVSWLAHRWNWTPKVVRRFLDQLEIESMITQVNPASKKGTQRGRQAKVLSICKYDYYQSHGDPFGLSEGHPEGNHRATRGQPQGNTLRKKEEKNVGAGARARKVQEACQTRSLNDTIEQDAFSFRPDESSSVQDDDLYVNGVTIRHKNFTIDIPKIEMQLATRINVNRDQVRGWCLDVARRWSKEWSKGIMPIGASNPTKYISEQILQIDNPRNEIRIEGERIILEGSRRKYWLEQFGGDAERLELSLLQAVPYIREDGRRSIPVQVEAQLGRQVAEIKDRDKRYGAAAKANANAKTSTRGGQPKTESKEDVLARYKKLEGGI